MTASLATDPRVSRYCRAWASRSTAWDREDVAAEGLLGVVRAGDPPPGVDPLAAAIRAARRAMWTRLMAGIRDRRRAIGHAAGRPRAWHDPGETLDASQRLDTLTERQRACVWLGIGLGWSWASVGDVAGCSPRAARMTAARAIERLRACE